MSKHGYRYHLLYNVWRAMRSRCCYKHNDNYKYYGGRGIFVCDEWQQSAGSFIRWALLNGWEKGLHIDRIDNNGNYCPGNCRFLTPSISVQNQRLLRSHNTSGYRGVSFHKLAKKWTAHIRINGKLKHLGYFASPRLAAFRYDVEAYLTDERPRNLL